VTTILARANMGQLVPTFDSKAEAWWDRYGATIIADECDTAVALTQYHPFTLHIPGGNYTPDWLHILSDGRLVVVEIKGSTKQRGYRDARSKLRSAAETFRWLTFYEAIVNGDGCAKLERIA
jgi:hypothetical protein